MAVFEKLLNPIFSQHSPDKQTSLIFSWRNHQVCLSVLTADGLTLNYLNHTNSETFLTTFKFSLQTDIHNVKCLQHLSYLDETRQTVAHHGISWHINANYSKCISSASMLSCYTHIYIYQTEHEHISSSSPTRCITRSPAIADNWQPCATLVETSHGLVYLRTVRL